MNKKNQIHLYGEGQPSPVIIDVGDDAKIADVLGAAQRAGVIGGDAQLKDVHLFRLDEEEPMAADQTVGQGDKRPKLHCHRCRKIEVTVTFNLDRKSRSFPPSTLVGKVLKWALREFKLTGADAENKELRIGGQNGQAMLEDVPVGSYVRHPQCELLAYLADIVQVQG